MTFAGMVLIGSGFQDGIAGIALVAFAARHDMAYVALRMRVFFADAFVLADVADQAERPAFAGRTVVGDFVRRGQNEFIARRRVVATPKAM